jgi:uncharacterized protein YndB with AHSA1/START domain
MEKYITLERTINAPVEKVWEAWTNPEEIKKWWGPNGVTIPTATVDLKVGGELYIVMLAGPELGPMNGQEWPMRGAFVEIVPNQKLVFSNMPVDAQGNALMEGTTTVTFEDVSGKTKLTVVTGAKGEGPNVEMMLGGMEMGWNQQLDKLVAFAK